MQYAPNRLKLKEKTLYGGKHIRRTKSGILYQKMSRVHRLQVAREFVKHLAYSRSWCLLMVFVNDVRYWYATVERGDKNVYLYD